MTTAPPKKNARFSVIIVFCRNWPETFVCHANFVFLGHREVTFCVEMYHKYNPLLYKSKFIISLTTVDLFNVILYKLYWLHISCFINPFSSLLLGISQSQRPRSLRCRSAAARQLRVWVRIPLGARMSVCCDYCVFSGRGLCVGLITRPEESYLLSYVVVCDLETSWMRWTWATRRGVRGGGWCSK